MTIGAYNNQINNFTNVQNTNNVLERIATGIELNKASDDAASLAISENLNLQANGVSQAMDNVNSAVAASQIGDRALGAQSDILDNIKQDLLQAANGTTSQEGREALLNDIQKQLQGLNDIADQTNYNGENLLQLDQGDTSASNALEVQAGEGEGDTIETDSIQSNTTGLGLDDLLNQDPSTFDAAAARDFLDNIDDAVTQVNDYRGDLGSSVNQLESQYSNLASQYTNTLAADSVLSATDYANEVSNFSKQNLFAQIGAMTQAQSTNVNSNNVLRLLT